MTEYLKDFPADKLLDSSNFFNQFSKLLNTEKHDGADMANIKDVVQGKKEVAVPPGNSLGTTFTFALYHAIFTVDTRNGIYFVFNL